jgi:hypothetical protein
MANGDRGSLLQYVDSVLAQRIGAALHAAQRLVSRPLNLREAEKVAREVTDAWSAAMHDAGFGELVDQIKVRVKPVPAENVPCIFGGPQHCPHESRCCHCGYKRPTASELN